MNNIFDNIKLSIVSPVYRGEKMVSELVRRIVENVETITPDYEVILVNDASPDNSWLEIEKECAKNTKVKGINLSRNFGQHYAITAGLNYAKGEWVVVMDCDLQDRPEEIPNLYKKAQEGYEVVLAQRLEREDSWLKRMSSKCFYTFFSYLTETKQDSSVANFGIYKKCVVDAILSMGDKMRYFPAQVQWIGFNRAYLPIQHDARAEGKSSYNFKRLFKLALDTIIAFSDKPMRLIVKIGFIITIVSLLVGVIYLLQYLRGEIVVMGYASLIISLCAFSGVIISILGIIGLYIGKMFETVKNRPVFIVSNALNVEK